MTQVMRKKSREDQGSKSVKTGQGERVGYGGKRNVFRLERKESREVQERRERGREFPIVGAAKEKDLRPRASLTSGTTKRCLSIDLSSLVGT